MYDTYVIKESDTIDSISSKIGYMLQKDCLLEWRTVLSNTLFGLEVKGNKSTENVQYVEDLLKKYNLYEFKDKYPSELSGGMRQRVALIRTLAIDIYSILRKENITAIIVTHDISEAISMSDRIFVLSKRPGTIKSIHNIDFEREGRTPLNSRENPKFSQYFNTLWKELGGHEK